MKLDTLAPNQLELAKQDLNELQCILTHWSDRLSMYKDPDYKTEETIQSQIHTLQTKLTYVEENIRRYQESGAF